MAVGGLLVRGSSISITSFRTALLASYAFFGLLNYILWLSEGFGASERYGTERQKKKKKKTLVEVGWCGWVPVRAAVVCIGLHGQINK